MVTDIIDKEHLLDALGRLVAALTAVCNAEYISKDDQVTVDLSNYYTKSEISNGYVAKVSGKNLSSNDYTTAEKNKLAGIADNANNYTYTLPAATSSVLGGVKIGSNITNSSGTISISKANVTSALGYTPPTANTTYSVGTASALGLTKLYTGTGNNTDGTMTQAAINVALSNFSADVILGTTPLTVEGGVWVEW